MVGQDCNFNIFQLDARGAVVDDYLWVLTNSQFPSHPGLHETLSQKLLIKSINFKPL